MNTPSLHFLGWHAPAIELVANKLLELNATAPDTFRKATVVVPTAESGRRLREYMAERAGRPILMPRIRQVNSLIPCADSIEEATEYAAWIRVLSRHEPQETWPTLFPEAPAVKLNWCRGMAQKLMSLRRKLEDACLSPQQIQAGLCQAEERESRRWAEIANIFSLVDRQIYEWGYPSRKKQSETAAAQAAHAYKNKWLILACLPQLTEKIRRFADDILTAGGTIQVYINAPQEKRHLFDSRYGLPLSAWTQQPIDIPEEQITVTANGAELATQALSACQGHQPADIALGNCDPTFAPVLRNAFSYAGWPLNMPEGRSFLATEAGQLAGQLLRAILGTGASHSTEPLLRNLALQRSFLLTPAMQHAFSLWLDDEIQQKMPYSMKEMLLHAAKFAQHEYIPTYLKNVQSLLEQLNDAEQLPDALEALGDKLARAYSRNESAEALAAFAKTAKDVAQIIRKVPEFCHANEALGMLQALVNQQAGDTMGLIATPKHNTVLDASGWMELPFCPAGKLILCGLHESCVPESPSIDAFLPESLCRQYPQLPHMEQRIARDSFLLTALLRAYGDSARIITAKMTDDGTPIVPSQLLLRCPEQPANLLLQRVATLFREVSPKETARQLATWQMRTPITKVAALENIDLLGDGLANPWQDPKKHFSPSRLATFLNCPLRFWLKSLLHMDPQDTYETGKSACNPAEYGTILHKVLELLVKEYPRYTPELTSEGIEAAASQLLREQFESRFGKKLSMPLLAQKKMMESSLKLFSIQHLADLAAGWECIMQEFHTEDCAEEEMWKFDGDAVFHMTIDRVDRRPKPDGSGYTWRIVDYKTGDYTPQEKHLEALNEESQEAFRLFMADFPLLVEEKSTRQKTPSEVTSRWKELQLPLYAQWLMDTHHIAQEDIEVGYYLLPRNKKDCRYASWNISPLQQESAMQWTRTAIRLIRNGLCLVSAESLGLTAYDTFGALAQDGDPRLMMGLPALTLHDNAN